MESESLGQPPKCAERSCVHTPSAATDRMVALATSGCSSPAPRSIAYAASRTHTVGQDSPATNTSPDTLAATSRTAVA